MNDINKEILRAKLQSKRLHPRKRPSTTDLPHEIQERHAMKFSEGSEELKKLLLTLWRSGIETNGGCCSGIQDFIGHLGESSHIPYIGISISPKQVDKIVNLLINPLEVSDLEKFNVRITAISDKEYKSMPYEPLLVFQSKTRGEISKEAAESFFKQINGVIKNSITSKKTELLPCIGFLTQAIKTISIEHGLPNRCATHLIQDGYSTEFMLDTFLGANYYIYKTVDVMNKPDYLTILKDMFKQLKERRTAFHKSEISR